MKEKTEDLETKHEEMRANVSKVNSVNVKWRERALKAEKELKESRDSETASTATHSAKEEEWRSKMSEASKKLKSEQEETLKKLEEKHKTDLANCRKEVEMRNKLKETMSARALQRAEEKNAQLEKRIQELEGQIQKLQASVTSSVPSPSVTTPTAPTAPTMVAVTKSVETSVAPAAEIPSPTTAGQQTPSGRPSRAARKRAKSLTESKKAISASVKEQVAAAPSTQPIENVESPSSTSSGTKRMREEVTTTEESIEVQNTPPTDSPVSKKVRVLTTHVIVTSAPTESSPAAVPAQSTVIAESSSLAITASESRESLQEPDTAAATVDEDSVVEEEERSQMNVDIEDTTTEPAGIEEADEIATGDQSSFEEETAGEPESTPNLIFHMMIF